MNLHPLQSARPLGLLLGLLLAQLSPAASAAIPVPADQIFAPPPQNSPKLSPDGKMIAFLGPWQQQANLFVQLLDQPVAPPPPPEPEPMETETETGDSPAITDADDALAAEQTPPPLPAPVRPKRDSEGYSDSGSHQSSLFPDRDTSLSVNELSFNQLNMLYREPLRISNVRLNGVDNYDWISNDELVYEVIDGFRQSSQLYLVVPQKGSRRALTEDSRIRHSLLDPLAEDPDHILITSNQRDRGQQDVYRLNLQTGQQELLENNPGTVIRWLTDHQGKLRAAISQNGLQRELLYRDDEQQPFRISHSSRWPDRIDPIMFSFDNAYLYVSSNIDRDTLAVHLYDPKVNQLLDLLYANPQADLTKLLASKEQKRVLAVQYETDKSHYYFPDEKDQVLFDDLYQRSGERTLKQISSSDDDRRQVFHIMSDMEPPQYFLFDRTDNSYRPLFNNPPYRLRAQMAEMRPVDFTASDGDPLHGYVTLPQGYQRGAIPFVVLPHDQPYRGRHHWGFNPLVQFLASRGYGVFLINYRGSSGYGKDYALAGRWGTGIMQQDLLDGINYLRRQGVAKRGKIAIYGERYAGFAAIAGAAFDPGYYQCAAAMAAPLDILYWLDTLPPHEEVYRARLQQQIGDPVSAAQQLRDNSPLSAIDQIHMPLLIAQARLDPRSRMQDLDLLTTGLRTRGVKVTTIIEADEFGPFREQGNRLTFYRALDNFLANCFGYNQ